jgi:hypothetical protein
MRTRRSIVGLGAARLVVSTLVAGGVLAPGGGILPAWLVPVGAAVTALALVSPVARPAGHRLTILVGLVAVVVSWATDLLQVKAIALLAGGLVILAVAWRGKGRPGGDVLTDVRRGGDASRGAD